MTSPFYQLMLACFQAEMAQAPLADPAPKLRLENPAPEIHLGRWQRHQEWSTGQYQPQKPVLSKAERDALARADKFGLLDRK